MSTRARVLGGVGALAFAGLIAGPAHAQIPAAHASKAPAALAQGPESLCANCHDQAKTMAGNPHVRAFLRQTSAAPPDAACTSCHGDGQKHAEEGGEKALIRGLHGAAGAKFCLTCHDKATDHSSFGAGSIHASTATVNCLTCHSIHSPEPRTQKLLARTPGALCQTCHTGQSDRKSTRLNSSHRL